MLSNNICPELFEEEIENNKGKYERALTRLRDPRDNEFLDRNLGLDRGHNYNHINNMVAPVIDEIYERRMNDQAKVDIDFYKSFLQKFFIVIKFQSITVKLYENSRNIEQHGEQMPSIQFVIGRSRIAFKIDRQKLNFQVLLEDIKILDTLQLKNMNNDRGTTTINDTFAVKSGFFLDEDITNFFRRHEGDDSIFQNQQFQSRFTTAGEQTANQIMINDRPRLHKYEEKGFEQTFNDHRDRHLAPDEIVQFSDRATAKEKNKQDQSMFNFEGFWKKKIGKLIGKVTDEDEHPNRRSHKGTDFKDHYNGYQDDMGRNMLERCCVLAEGDPVFLEIDFSYNLFASAKERKAINANLFIRNLRIEYSNDLVKNFAEAMFALRKFKDFGDISIASSREAFDRKIKLWTPWYLVKQAFTINDFNPHGGRTTGITPKDILEENKYVADENAAKASKNTQKSLAGLDRSIKLIDLKAKIVIDGLFLSLNSNLDSKRFRNNRNLLQIKTEPFEIVIIKHAEKCGLSVLGVQMMTQSSFELLFQFSLQMQKALSIYLDNPVFKDGKKFYEEILHKKVIESNKRFAPNSTLMRYDGSTIRHTGAGNNFSMSEAPRFSSFGGSLKNRATGNSTSRGGNRKFRGTTPPRNKPTMDFESIKKIGRNHQTMGDRPDPMFQSEPKLRNTGIAPQRIDDVDNDYEDGSFNDTDEEVLGLKADIMKSPTKRGVKVKGKGKVKVRPETVVDPIERRPMQVQKRVEEDVMAKPRTGPSRLQNQGNPKLRKHVSWFICMF